MKFRPSGGLIKVHPIINQQKCYSTQLFLIQFMDTSSIPHLLLSSYTQSYKKSKKFIKINKLNKKHRFHGKNFFDVIKIDRHQMIAL